MFTILPQGKQHDTTLRRDNQQETCPRRSVVHSCFPCSNPWFAWASKRRCPGEALLLVVKVVRVVFPCIHVDSAGNVSKAKRCSLLFPYKQPLVCMGLEEAMSWRSVVSCCKSCSSCFPMCPRRFSRRKSRRLVGDKTYRYYSV